MIDRLPMKKPRRTPPRRLSPELRERRAEAADGSGRAKSPQRSGPREPSIRRQPEAEQPRERSGWREGGAREKPLRIHGLNAVLALWPSEVDRLRRLYLSSARAHELGGLLRELAHRNIAYRIVGEDDLRRLTGTEHHQGIAADLEDEGPLELGAFLRALASSELRDEPSALLWLDGVMNPHNLGAILRSAAHFGVGGVLIGEGSPLMRPSGAIARVAEGGLFAMPRIALGDEARAIDSLKRAGFMLAATVVEGGEPLFELELPRRTIFILGAEGDGMSAGLREAADRRLTIPGSGAVESLNVSASMAVFFAAFRARYPIA